MGAYVILDKETTLIQNVNEIIFLFTYTNFHDTNIAHQQPLADILKLDKYYPHLQPGQPCLYLICSGTRYHFCLLKFGQT